MDIFDKDYWSGRYQAQDTGWDTGGATPPIRSYFDAVSDKDARILIPGCGPGYEAEYLHRQGFKHVYICDWAEEPLAAFQARVPDFPAEHLLCLNFFDIQDLRFDYIIEQTFFCALPPALRPDYARKMRELLAPSGKLVGLLFRFPLTEAGPPFGGSEDEYRGHFQPHFSQIRIQPCETSIKPRLGNEFWIEVE